MAARLASMFPRHDRPFTDASAHAARLQSPFRLQAQPNNAPLLLPLEMNLLSIAFAGPGVAVVIKRARLLPRTRSLFRTPAADKHHCSAFLAALLYPLEPVIELGQRTAVHAPSIRPDLARCCRSGRDSCIVEPLRLFLLPTPD